jgi:hypothetical protein
VAPLIRQCQQGWHDGRMSLGWLSGGHDRTGAIPDGSVRDLSFVGGMRIGGTHNYYRAPRPFAVLDLHGAGVRIRLRGRVLGATGPTWEARYEELVEVRSIGRVPWFSTGVRFLVETGPNRRAVFRSFRPRRLRVALADRSVDVQ